MIADFPKKIRIFYQYDKFFLIMAVIRRRKDGFSLQSGGRFVILLGSGRAKGSAYSLDTVL